MQTHNGFSLGFSGDDSLGAATSFGQMADDAGAAARELAREQQLAAEQPLAGIKLSPHFAMAKVCGTLDLSDPGVIGNLAAIRIAEEAYQGDGTPWGVRRANAITAIYREIEEDAPRRAAILAMAVPGQERLVARLLANGTSRSDAALQMVTELQRGAAQTAALDAERAADARDRATLAGAQAFAKRIQAYQAEELTRGYKISTVDAAAAVSAMDLKTETERRRI